MRPKKKGHNRKENKSYSANAADKTTYIQKNEQVNYSNKSQITDATKNTKQEISINDIVASCKPSPSVESTNTESTINVRKYRKREIKSNWDKYDLPEEEDGDNDTRTTAPSPVTERGCDFSFLQTVGGGVGSQFRFLDEKDWADDIDGTSELLNQFQLLDIKDLATSLCCVPVHKRLDIDTAYFTHEQLLQFESAASATQKIYQKRNSTTNAEFTQVPSSLSTDIPQTKEECVTEILMKTDALEEAILSSVQNETHVAVENENDISEILISDSVNLSDHGQAGIKARNESDDELDALLNLNTICKEARSIDITPIVAPKLDSSVAPSKPVMKIPEISDLPKPKVEDWLDEFFIE